MKIDQDIAFEDLKDYLERVCESEELEGGVRLPELDLRKEVSAQEVTMSFAFADAIYQTSSKRIKVNTACPHPDRKHYAKNMCSTCYHKTARPTRAWKCPHTFLPHYAKGRCHDCYLTTYYKRKRQIAHSDKD